MLPSAFSNASLDEESFSCPGVPLRDAIGFYEHRRAADSIDESTLHGDRDAPLATSIRFRQPIAGDGRNGTFLASQ